MNRSGRRKRRNVYGAGLSGSIVKTNTETQRLRGTEKKLNCSSLCLCVSVFILPP
jgi:hypothetical protein